MFIGSNMAEEDRKTSELMFGSSGGGVSSDQGAVTYKGLISMDNKEKSAETNNSSSPHCRLDMSIYCLFACLH